MARIYVADNKYESGIIKVYRVDSKYDVAGKMVLQSWQNGFA